MFFSRHTGGDRVILIQIETKRQSGFTDLQADAEFLDLAKASGAYILEHLVVKLDKFNSGYLISSGKRNYIKAKIESQEAELVIVSHQLTSTQERNLEREWQCRVIDRVGLILDIFAQRARTFEGKLQVELAQLEHLRTRLVRGWTHLERQKGGIGLRGPGETQLETDRRLIQVRINSLKKSLEKVKRQRQNNRNYRQKGSVPIVAIVGYTNAGKSTLFNSLTQAQVYVANKLFATLDTSMRKLDLGSGLDVVLVDTVGFIKDLPHELVEAFSATLEEAAQADLILHLIDAHDWNRSENIIAVEQVLDSLGIKNVPIIKVFNKIDLLSSNSLLEKNQLQKLQSLTKETISVWTSATEHLGLDELKQKIRTILELDICKGDLMLDYSGTGGILRARLYSLDAVEQEFLYDDKPVLKINLALKELKKLLLDLNLDLKELKWLTGAQIV